MSQAARMRLTAVLLAIGAALAFGLLEATHANAFIYWAAETGDTIGRAELDGTGSDQSFVPNADAPCGDVAVDGAHVYWANYGSNTIGRSNLNGTGVDQSFITGADGPCQVAVDDAHVYWGNFGNGSIGRANLDGTGAAQNFVTGATNLGGLAVTSTHVYWTNRTPVNTIGRAALATPGSPDQSFISGASGPTGLTTDATHLYWANTTIGTLGRAAVSAPGSPNQSFLTGLNQACGVAVDSTHIFWSDAGTDTIGSAPLADPDGLGKNPGLVTGLDGTNPCGVAIDTLGAPSCQSISASTRPSEPVAINLPCDPGGGTSTVSIIAPPANGQVTGFSSSTGSLTYTPAPGFHGADSFTYRATNQAATSATATGSIDVLASSNDFTLGKAKKNRKNGTAKLSVNVPGPGEVLLSRTKKVGAAETSAEGAGSVTLRVKPRGKTRKQLDQKGKARVSLAVTFLPVGGDPATESAKVQLSKK